MHFHIKLMAGGRMPKRGQRLVDGVYLDTDAVGYDLFANQSGHIPPFGIRIIPLGFSSAFTPGYIAKIFDRSGLAAKNGIHSLAGVIDPDYRGEWKVILHNASCESFEYTVGDRIAQVVFFKVELPEILEVSQLEESLRGEGGLGSTGR